MKRSLLVLVVSLVLVAGICGDSDSLAECIGYCDTYWGDTDGGSSVMVDEGEYYACVETCGNRK